MKHQHISIPRILHRFTRLFSTLFLLVVMLVPHVLRAQYSPDVMKLRQAQDLYDQRGYNQGAALSVDGNLAINNQNGTPSYVYPISSFISGGHQVTTSLSYCGSVQFTAFKDYDLGNRRFGTEYSGWARFHQNRPAWILGVNGWAVNLIGIATHMHADPASTLFNSLITKYSDQDLIWLADGYDFCNRMRDFKAMPQSEAYRDVIRLLRADGSVMELMNIHTRTETNNENPDILPELYTGYYFVNETNTRGYGVVSFDSTQFMGPAWEHLATSVVGGQRYPLLPRVLRYFPGDGTEVIFRERIAPYGVLAYQDLETRGGGLWGHPTIFYLEEIRSNAGTVVEFKRSRHSSPAEAVSGYVTTRGRAPVTSFTGHEISIGDKSMTIEALGRTTKVIFDRSSRSGNTVSGETMPYARLGGATDDALELAAAPEYDPRLYKSFTGYVTSIVDPMDRATTFTYETYTKRYDNTGFPRADASIRVSLSNYRLKTITEPTSRYTLSYYGNRDESIIPSDQLPMKLNNMVDTVKKFDRSGGLLLTDVYRFDVSNQVGTTISWQHTTDNVSGHVVQKSFVYESFPLNNYQPILVPGRHTVLKQVIETAGTTSTGMTETVTTTNYGTAGQVPGWGGWQNYTVLPVSQLTSINGITKSYQTFAYEMKTLRDFWRTPELGASYGREITRKVTRTLRPDDLHTPLLVDTEVYLHLPMPDSFLVAGRVRWNKLASIANYFLLRDTLMHPDVVGKRWEEVMYRSPVAVFERDTVAQYIPPIFGLTERSWTTTPEGAVTGKRNVYITASLEDGEATPRGMLLADSILGSDGQSILKGTYAYKREWSGHLLSSVRNALGVQTTYSYSQKPCLDVPFWEECTTPAPAVGTVIANDGTTRTDTLAWTPFSFWFSKPAGEQSVVRRYDAVGEIWYDTLQAYTERTFHGLAGATVEPNGYLSRFAYDYNGRLGVGWLPGDFPGTDIQTLPPYQGRESVDLFGTTHHHRRADWQFCRADGSSEIISGSTVETIHNDTLYARLPVTSIPKCPCEQPQEMKGDDDDREMASAPCRDESFPLGEYAEHKGFFGHLWTTLDASHPLKMATRIDSLTFETMITSVDGSCVHLEVAVDSIFTRTYVLGCPDAPADGDDDDAPAGKASKRNDGDTQRERALQASGSTGGAKFVVNLSSIAPQLAARPAGSAVTIELRVKTPGASVAFINGTNSEDLRPRLNVYGEYKKVWDRADYTIAFEHDDKALTTTERAKVDDTRHTANNLESQGIDVRRSTAKTIFGADYRVLKSERTVIEPGATRTDLTQFAYTGLGAATKTVDAEKDSVQTRYDAMNRPIAAVNADGTETKLQYIHARPDSLGITDQDFLGYCDLTISADEKGTRFARFSDALGRLRREVADYGTDGQHSNTTTKFNYDLLGRLVEVVNPKGDITTYTYDEFGRVKTKTHPDLGTISYVYDKLGNARFVQDQRQAETGTLTYNQYDDLNRITLIGEAAIDETGTCAPYNEEQPGTACGDGTRLTEKLDGNILHIEVYPDAPLTANPTLFRKPFENVPDLPWIEGYKLKGCNLNPMGILGETERPTAPFIMHTARQYPARDMLRVYRAEFEDLESYPETARIGIAYDRMPISSGAVWGTLPLVNLWDRLTPSGTVRNQKGREAAVAYRDKSSEPFHYTVMSYDERGRVEALLRYNENLGFDAVYYQYNSGNQVIAVMVADPVRRFTTWYGYDYQGRIDSVWTKLDGPGSGLMSDGTFNYLRFPGFPDSPARQGIPPEIVYSYTKTDRVRTMSYPAIGTLVEYAYNHRKFLDSLVARRGGNTVFSQRLGYDPTGQIRSQEYRHASAGTKKQIYDYDPLRRLTGWSLDGKSTTYAYDALGNREAVHRQTAPIETYSYYMGTNRLSRRVQPDYHGGDTTHSYSYDANGSETNHLLTYRRGNDSRILREEYLGYNFRDLNNRARVRVEGSRWQDWRYRYNAMGEREQKRAYPVQDGVVPNPDSSVMPWVYYLLGGDKQLAVYHGQQVDSTQTRCGDAGINRVYMYPWEYISYGVGHSGLLITRPTGRREYKLVDHLGSTRAVLDQNGNVIGRYDNTPFGEQIAVAGVDSRKKFIDKEQDQESSTYNVGVRQYDPARGAFASVDPLWENYHSVSPYQYGLNNPVRLADYDGKEVLNILGPDADKATRELDKETSLTLTRDSKSGEINATGKAKTAADKKLLEAINAKDVVVNLTTTKQHLYPSIDGSTQPLRVGAFDGSTVDATGVVQTSQFINLQHAVEYNKVGGGSVGLSVLHEVNESYIGGRQFPGQPYSTANFNAAHAATLAIDPPQANVQPIDPTVGGIVHVGLSGPSGTVTLYKYDPKTLSIVP